jgi:hypothetical protein
MSPFRILTYNCACQDIEEEKYWAEEGQTHDEKKENEKSSNKKEKKLKDKMKEQNKKKSRR